MTTRQTASPTGERSWRRRHSAAIWAVAACTLLAVALGVALATGNEKGGPPADGSDCVGASASEIRAWVRSHEKEIPSGLPLSDVADQVEKRCDRGLAIFNATLLTEAINSAAVARSTATSP
jgi:hypothetical protein